MIKNWKITAWLNSPLCGEPPALDAVLAWELSLRLGSKHHKKLTRNTKLKDIDVMPVPVAKRTISGVDILCCSDPILPEPLSEWEERQSKRFDTTHNALILAEKNRKSLLVASGPYKQRYSPLRVRLVENVVWFARCSRKETNKLLKSIISIGKGRNYGYGLVRCWDFEPTEGDFSIFSQYKGKNVLMKTIPLKCALELESTGYRRDYGAWQPPYWHPENFDEVAKPC